MNLLAITLSSDAGPIVLLVQNISHFEPIPDVPRGCVLHMTNGRWFKIDDKNPQEMYSTVLGIVAKAMNDLAKQTPQQNFDAPQEIM